ncbi:alanine--tRNA ligase [Candidatus Aerophobetes bacterium]|uniref:Alanine--tRNA ligase n=1 Tax=Aerophobetes bacterium TaxID=2030807 RepID=A0A2A4YN05_UNCAE|nr:MAG: alanine--tRNA ligase [Candidatus Aerophobetes bacterium]
MISQKIRKEFLQFFKNNDHKVVPSAPVIPHNDPTLLFINAGMNQFKDVFIGKTPSTYKRATTSQKCVRVGGKHNDLDNVGHTTRHATFFEMLGNFSFGDYFKEKAIDLAYEHTMTSFKFPEDRLIATVYQEDDESYELWKKHLPESRIVRMGKKDNFWMMGDTGPCGPCSELYFDKGERFGSATSPADDPDGERYLEFWNLVFMEFNSGSDGKLTQLPNKSVDTGAGLERIVSLIEGVDSIFQIDIFRELIAEIESVLGAVYEYTDTARAPAFHVIADHMRSLSFAIADGAQPGNVDRGYVLRKILRRAVRYGRKLGANGPFLAKIFPRLLSVMGDDFPELKASKNKICEILTQEEEGFLRTLKRGGNILTTVVQKAESSSKKEISAEDAFKLKDTYGFPLEEILLIAKDSNLKVNLDSYQLLEEAAKERSKKAKESHVLKFEINEFEKFVKKHGPCEFVGYTENEAESTILEIIKEGKPIETLDDSGEAFILLDKSPFYAEKGGQISDVGELRHASAHFKVEETIAPHPDLIIHRGRLVKGCLIAGEPVAAKINLRRREHIENNHSATHLLHYALQKVLGEHIKQAGSLVGSDRLRFDFNHHKSVSPEELREIEDIVNEKINANSPVKTYELSYDKAQKSGEIKQFFGDKYGSTVRVVDIADFSKELCGGTHAPALGRLGLFKILKESSIASGVRRIEALTGKAALNEMHRIEDNMHLLAKKLETPLTKIFEKIDHLLDENKGLKAELKKFRSSKLGALAKELAKEVQKEGDISFIAKVVDIDSKELFSFANTLSGHIKDAIILLGIKSDAKCQLLLKVPDMYFEKGIKANVLMKEISPLIQGSGGGKEGQAQAGGSDPSGLEKAMDKFKQLLKTC